MNIAQKISNIRIIKEFYKENFGYFQQTNRICEFFVNSTFFRDSISIAPE